VLLPPRPDDADTLALAAAYADHPAAVSGLWSPSYVPSDVPWPDFRSDGAYVRQAGSDDDYRLTRDYVVAHDRFGLADVLDDDGAFGARVRVMDGRRWTRDLLDSISELTFLGEHVPGLLDGGATVLEVGAGYGRFAHRFLTAAPGSTVLCADAVPFSTRLCRFYLDFRGVSGAEVVPLDRLDALAGRRIDLAVVVHVFNEIPHSAVRWWLDLLARLDVPRLLLVPNDRKALRAFDGDGRWPSFQEDLAAVGYTLQVGRDKYHLDARVQERGLYPGMYLLYARRPERSAG
jgi:hypothetical protein